MSIDGPQSEPHGEDLFAGLMRRMQNTHRLFVVHWELTNRCNQRCSHCYLDVDPPDSPGTGELSTAECLDVIDQIAALGALNLTLSGGEIFVRRDLFEIAAHARSRRLLLRLFTNGTRIGPRTAARIAALHPYSVEISLYSHDPAVHDAITRTPGAWQRTTRAVRHLREAGVRVALKTPMMRENIRLVPELQALAESLGASFRLGAGVTTKADGRLDPLAHRVDFEDLVAYYRHTLRPENWLNRKIDPTGRVCGIGGHALVIDPYGNVSPCVEVRVTAGNLRRQRLKDIWEHSPAWDQVRGLTHDTLPVCRPCELRSLCTRCHGMALLEDGDLHGPARFNCFEALARRRALIDLGRLPADYPIPARLRPVPLTTQTAASVAA